MKLSALMLAGLLGLTSVAAFAEGGSDRVKEHFNNFSFIQEQTRSSTEQTAAADTKGAKSGSAEQARDTEQPKS
ncbi:hypothetical protein H097_16975 [Pseudomonas sp. FH4]|jgi:hypothetical protein|uniref:Secreted protein n=1 Tax=Pseudomonas brenneri TaxID=129817 RepID=A0A5B2V5A1_9PSED|nr:MULTISPECIES: hypothetical protein [Pseudomonas]ETK17084.1 hypothetical protein H097_16975 [Pseudomonas sp. FH4]KAA2233715.1 hypothetical protein F1720_01430 [Pseudomonas brenneri]MBF8005855.1 hypothetical protein [Pseudomonas brenneri]TWR82051.1 hypothetical protein FJD34_01275 [Pseudomonas brenneri]WJM88976.1 hypothetical protein QDY63_16425 [Pseudomonas brenneri]